MKKKQAVKKPLLSSSALLDKKSVLSRKSKTTKFRSRFRPSRLRKLHFVKQFFTFLRSISREEWFSSTPRFSGKLTRVKLVKTLLSIPQRPRSFYIFSFLYASLRRWANATKSLFRKSSPSSLKVQTAAAKRLRAFIFSSFYTRPRQRFYPEISFTNLELKLQSLQARKLTGNLRLPIYSRYLAKKVPFNSLPSSSLFRRFPQTMYPSLYALLRFGKVRQFLPRLPGRVKVDISEFRSPLFSHTNVDFRGRVVSPFHNSRRSASISSRLRIRRAWDSFRRALKRKSLDENPTVPEDPLNSSVWGSLLFKFVSFERHEEPALLRTFSGQVKPYQRTGSYFGSDFDLLRARLRNLSVFFRPSGVSPSPSAHGELYVDPLRPAFFSSPRLASPLGVRPEDFDFSPSTDVFLSRPLFTYFLYSYSKAYLRRSPVLSQRARKLRRDFWEPRFVLAGREERVSHAPQPVFTSSSNLYQKFRSQNLFGFFSFYRARERFKRFINRALGTIRRLRVAAKHPFYILLNRSGVVRQIPKSPKKPTVFTNVFIPFRLSKFLGLLSRYNRLRKRVLAFGRPASPSRAHRLVLRFTSNNSFLTLTDFRGRVLSWISPGTVSFKGSKRATPYATAKAAKEMLQRILARKVQKLVLVLQDHLSSRAWECINVFSAAKSLRFSYILDRGARPHSLGPRPKKSRRV